MANAHYPYVGVDRDSSGWVAVSHDGSGNATVAVFEDFQKLWDEFQDYVERIVVDIPIGLCGSIEDGSVTGGEVEDGEAHRACDNLARTAIGARHPSVFNAPAREAATKVGTDGEYDYSEVNESNKDAVNKGLTQQAASIAKEIVEVERFLTDGVDTGVVVEGHPEVSFRAFKKSELEYSKKTAAGVDERLGVLESVEEFEDISWRDLARELGADYDNGDVGLDDLFDALALAMTASASREELQGLPEGDDPPRDGEGLPVQMVYRADEPLNL